MSILVNFLKMPNNCDDCIVSCDCPVDASYDGYKMEGGRPRYCPLVEVNEKLFSADNARKFLEDNPPKEGET